MIQIGNAKIYIGDCIDIMQGMPDGSVHCCITSPPYFGLRDYHAGPKMIGLEPTFQEWLDKMVAVSAELWRVLRDDGTYWLNCGDAYASTGTGGHGATGGRDKSTLQSQMPPMNTTPKKRNLSGFKERDLMMMPARLAIALHSWGWYIRSEIIWSKPNPMPESCKNRPTSSHEKIYLLTKKPRYFYDADAVREKSTGNRHHPGYKLDPPTEHAGIGHKGFSKSTEKILPDRNQRNVWNITTKPYPDAHFATFPPEIPRRCIMAGTSERGCCPECGNQWERVVEVEYTDKTSNTSQIRKDHEGADSTYMLHQRCEKNVKTIGWQPTCDHDHDPVPSTVLDPFAGSGTTLEVALSLNRKAIGIELNKEYVELMKSRIMKEASQEKLNL